MSSLIDVELSFVASSILPLNWAVKVCGSIHRPRCAHGFEGGIEAILRRCETGFDPFSFLVVAVAGWLNRRQQRVVDYLRIQGALANLGYSVARTRIANILKHHAITPAPERIKQTTWKEFLKQHWDQIIATGLLHRGGLDLFRVNALRGALLHGRFDAKSPDRWNREQARWIVDDADCSQSDGCRRRIHPKKTLSDP